MTTPDPGHTSTRLIVIRFNGRCRRFDLDGDGRLSFAHVARVFRIPLNGPDDCDAWTLDDTSLRIDKSDPGALLTVSALRDLFPLPSGSTDQPLVLRTDDADPPDAAPSHLPRQTRKSTGNLANRGNAVSPISRGGSAAGAAAAAAASASVTSPTTRAAAAAAAATAMITPRARNAAAGELPPQGPGYQTPGGASPLRGARTPLGLIQAPPQGSPGRAAARRPATAGPLEPSWKPSAADSDLFRHPRGQGTFHFTAAAAQHLPVLMACHLPPPLQRLLRHFSVSAQCTITARAMALYARISESEYFRDQRLEAALTEARSRNPPQDRYCAYPSQAVRLTGRKRKPAASQHPPAAATPPLTLHGDGGGGAGTAAEAPTPPPPSCTDVDMDAGGWAFVGGATLHCPGGAACRRAGRHENWLLSDSADGRVTYLPVLYDNEEHSAVLLPLADPRVTDPQQQHPLVWFRYEYESRGGRRGHNFWDRGLQEHLEQAVRDVVGEDALRTAKGA